jgi:hypothetical protein
LIDIDTLTAKTILADEIFEEIMADEDLMHQARLIIELTDKANDFGASIKKQFETLLKASKKMALQKAKEQKTLPSSQNTEQPMTDLDSPYPQMFCGSWIVNNNGVNGFNSLGMPITACYHPIIPVSVTRNIHTNNVKIKLAYKNYGEWQELTVDKAVVASATRATSLSGIGIGVDSEISKHFVRYISEMENWNQNTIKIEYSISKLGWVNNEFMPYSTKFVVDSDSRFPDAINSIKEKGSRDKWINLIKEIRQSKRFEPKISIVGSLASILIEPLNALPFILNLWTETGKGKTVCMMIAASCWANPDGFQYMSDPKDTVTSMELRLDLYNNLPFMLDDMSQVKEKYQGDFSALVYMLCSGKGKNRANVNLGMNPTTNWKNIILTNYEHSLVTETMQGGAVNRIIDVECLDENMFPNGNEVVGILKQNYGFIGREFIDAVKQIGFEKIREWQKKAYDAIIKRAKSLGVEKEEKQILPMSILLTADRIATEYIFNDGIYLDFNTCVDLLKNKGEVSENERAYEFILSEVNINRNKFIPDQNGQYRGEIWGAIDGGYAIIQKNIFSKFAKEGNFSERSFLSWAAKRNLIDSVKGRVTKQKRFDGAPSWCVFLKMPSDSEDDQGFMKVPEELHGKLPFN